MSMHRTNISLPPAMIARLMAFAHGRSLAEMVRASILAYLDSLEARHGGSAADTPTHREAGIA